MRKCAFILLTVAYLGSALAQGQTGVTTTNGGTSGSVPVFTSNKNVENSVITQSNGNVGIGTTSPGASLDVLGYSGSSQTNVGKFDNGTNGAYTSMSSAGPTSVVPTWNNGAQILEFVPYSSGNGIVSAYTGNLLFQTNYRTTQMSILPNGNVGIGTASPSQPLEVNGNAKVDGTLTVVGSGGLSVEAGGILFPDGSLQTTAYPASSQGGSAPIEVQNNEAVINGGVSANGSGLKHVSTNSSCTATSDCSHTDETCGVVISWPGTAFADTNYTVSCTAKNVVNHGFSWNIFILDSNKTTTSTTVNLIEHGACATVTLQGLNCIAIHD